MTRYLASLSLLFCLILNKAEAAPPGPIGLMARIPLTHDFWGDGCQLDLPAAAQGPLAAETRDDEWRGDPAELNPNRACERSEAMASLRDQIEQWQAWAHWTSEMAWTGMAEIQKKVVGLEQLIIQFAIDGAAYEESLTLADCANAENCTPEDPFHLVTLPPALAGAQNSGGNPGSAEGEDRQAESGEAVAQPAASADYAWSDLSRSYAAETLRKAACWLEALSRSIDSPRISSRKAGSIR